MPTLAPPPAGVCPAVPGGEDRSPYQDHVAGGDVHVGLHGLLGPGRCAAPGRGAGHRPITELGRHAVDARCVRGLWAFGWAHGHALPAQLLGDGEGRSVLLLWLLCAPSPAPPKCYGPHGSFVAMPPPYTDVTHTHAQVYIHTDTHMCACTYNSRHGCMIHTDISHMDIHTQRCTHVYAHHIHKYTWIYTHRYTHVCPHTKMSHT